MNTDAVPRARRRGSRRPAPRDTVRALWVAGSDSPLAATWWPVIWPRMSQRVVIGGVVLSACT